MSGRTREPGSTSQPTGTQAIERALLLLDLIAESGELTVAELASRSELAPPTVGRMMRALTGAGMTARNPRTDGFHLGPHSVSLGQAAQRALGLDHARPVLEGLREETGESVNLVVREGGESVVLLRAQSLLPLRFVQEVGARFPLYTTASGKAMLSRAAPDDSYVEQLPLRMTRIAPGTITSRRRLAEELASTRERGYAIDREENVEGVRCVGASICDADGIARAAIVVQAPAIRMDDKRIAKLGPRVAQIAVELEHIIPDPAALGRGAE